MKILVLGSQESGKSCLVLNFLGMSFSDSKMSTELLGHNRTREIEGQKYFIFEYNQSLQLGNDQKQIGAVDILVISLDLTKPEETLINEVRQYTELCNRHKKTDAVVVYAGTKSDLVNSPAVKLKQILESAGVKSTDKRCITSAKNGMYIVEALTASTNNYSISEFLSDYQLQYQKDLIKNSHSWMKKAVDNADAAKILCFASIFAHARKDGGRTARVLREKGIDFSNTPALDHAGNLKR
jgi:GTPase SAR1 family protein